MLARYLDRLLTIMAILANNREAPMTMEPSDLELPGHTLAVQPNASFGELEVALNWAKDFAQAEKAANTRRAYTADFAAFRSWCAGRGAAALPAAAETVAAYLSAEADQDIQAWSIGRRFATGH
jgi:hypothetical protein